MIQEASITGVLRTVFVVIGVLAVLRFLGKVMIARREAAKLQELEKVKDEIRKAQIKAEKEKGKVSIHNSSTSNSHPVNDVDFEEIN